MIKDISNIRRLPRAGYIRLGVKVEGKNGKIFPKEVDHFILDPDAPTPEERALLIKEFQNLYGENPKAIKIMFPVSDTEKYFPQNYRRYGSSTSLKCIGDGETAVCIQPEFTKGLKVLGKTETGLIRVECNGKSCIYHKSECSPVGILRVLLPELQGAGIWQVSTRSFNSIVNLNSCIDYITAICGRAHMIPLILERRPQDISYEGRKTTHYILHINMGFKLAEMQKIAQTATSQILLDLPAVDDTMEYTDTGVESSEEPDPSAESTDTDVYTTHAELMALSDGEDLSVPERQAKKGGTKTKKRTIAAVGPVPAWSPQDAMAGTVTFFEFMVNAKSEIIELTGDSGLYNSELESFNVRYLSELKDDTKKQADIKDHFERLLTETRNLNGIGTGQA